MLKKRRKKRRKINHERKDKIMASELLKRSEVKEADTWNVKDMYPTTEAWENELKVITEIVDKIALYEGSVAATAENLLF